MLQEVQTFIGGDAVDPCEELSILPELFYVLKDLDKYLLCNVIGVIVIDDHFTDMPIDLLLVLSHKEAKTEILRIRMAQLF